MRRNLPGEGRSKSAVHSLLEVGDHNLVATPAHSLGEEAAVHNPVGQVSVRNLASQPAGRNPAAAEGGMAADRNYWEDYWPAGVHCSRRVGAENIFHSLCHAMNPLHLLLLLHSVFKANFRIYFQV